MADAYSYLVALFLAATIAINFVINVVVLNMMRKRRLYDIVANRLFLQFVLIDFIACFFVFIPASVTAILESWEFSDPACHVHGVMTTFVYLVIFGLLIMRCAERITKIKNRDLHKAVFCSNCHLMLVSSVVWAVGLVVALLPLSGWVSFKYDYYHSGCVVQLEESALYIAVIFPLGVGLTAIFVVIAFVIISKADRILNDTQKLNGGKDWYKGNGSKPDENKNPNMATASANLIICTVSVICFFPYFLIMFIRAAGVDMWRGSYSICLIPIVLTFTLRPWIYLFRLKMAIKSKEKNTSQDPNAKNRILAVSRKGKRKTQSEKLPPGKPGEPTYSSDEWSEYDDSEKRNKACCFPKRSKKYDEKPSLDPPPYESDPEMKHPKPSPLRPIKPTKPGEKPKKIPVFKKPNQQHQIGSGVDEDEMSEFCLDDNSSENGSVIKPKNRSSLKQNKVKPSLTEPNSKPHNSAKNTEPKGRTKKDKRTNLSSNSDESNEPKDNIKNNDLDSFLSPRMIHIKEIPKQKKRKPRKKHGDQIEEETVSSEYSEDGKGPKHKRRRRKRRRRRPDEDDNSDSYDSYDDSEDNANEKQKKKPIVINHSTESPKSKKRNITKPKTSREPIDKEKLLKQNKLNPFIRIDMNDPENDKNKGDKKETQNNKSPKQNDRPEYNTEHDSDIEYERDDKPRRKKRGKPRKHHLSTESEYSDDDDFKRKHRRKNQSNNDDSDDDIGPRKRRKRRRRRRPYSDESLTEDEYDRNGVNRKPEDVPDNKTSHKKGNGTNGPLMNSVAGNDHNIDGGIMEEMLRRNMDSKISVEVHHNHYYIDPTRVGDQKNNPSHEKESNTHKSVPYGIPPKANWKTSNTGDPTSSSLDPLKAENPTAKLYNNAPLNRDNLPNSQDAKKSDDPSKIVDNLLPGDPLEPYQKRRLVPDEPNDSIPDHGHRGDPTKTLGPGDPIIPYQPEIVEDNSNLPANSNNGLPKNNRTKLLNGVGPGEPMQPYNDNFYNPKQQRNTADNLQSSPKQESMKVPPNVGNSADNLHGESPQNFTHLLGPGDPILKRGDSDDNGEDNDDANNAIKNNEYENKRYPNSNENQYYNNPHDPNNYPYMSDSQHNRNNPNYANDMKSSLSDPVSQYGNPSLSNNDPNFPDSTENPNRFNPYMLKNGEKRNNYPTTTAGMNKRHDNNPSNLTVSKPNDGRSNNPSMYSDTIPTTSNIIQQGKPQDPPYPYHKPGEKSNPRDDSGPAKTTSNPPGTSGQNLGPIPRSNLPQYNTYDPFHHNSPNSFDADRIEQQPLYPESQYNPNDNTYRPNTESDGDKHRRGKQPSIPRSNLYSMNKPKSYPIDDDSHIQQNPENYTKTPQNMPELHQVPNLGEFNSDPSRYPYGKGPAGSQQPSSANPNMQNGYPRDPTHPSNESSSLPFINNGYALPNTDGRSDWDTPLTAEQYTTNTIPKQGELIGPPKSYSSRRQKPSGGRAVKLGNNPSTQNPPGSIPENTPFDNRLGKNKLNSISNPEQYVPSSNGNGHDNPGVYNQYLPGTNSNDSPYDGQGHPMPILDENPNGHSSSSNKPGTHQNNNPNGHPGSSNKPGTHQNNNNPNGHPNSSNKPGTHQINKPNGHPGSSNKPGTHQNNNPNGHPNSSNKPGTHQNDNKSNNPQFVPENAQGSLPGVYPNNANLNPNYGRPTNPNDALPTSYPNNGIPKNSSYHVNPQERQSGAPANPDGNNPSGVHPQNRTANDPNGQNRNPTQGHGNPTQGQGNPTQGQGNPIQGHGNPTQGQGNPTQGHGNPTQGHGNPNVQQPNRLNKKVTFEPTNNSPPYNGPPSGSSPETAVDVKSRARANWKTARRKVFAYYHMTKLDKWDMVHGYDNKYDKRGKAPKVNNGGWKNQVKDIDLI